jgi:16S rRNA processing protein RimM
VRTVNPPAPWVLIGKIGRPVGLLGEVRVWAETDLIDLVEEEVPFSLWNPPAAPASAPELEEAREDGKGWVVRWEGIDSRQAAAALTHSWIVALREDLPEPEEDSVYWSDLLGAELRDPEDRLLGKVEGLFETAAHAILEVRSPQGKEFLVPLTEQIDAKFLPSKEQGEPHCLRVDLPEGLIEATTTPEPGEGESQPGAKRKPRRRIRPPRPKS